MLIKLTKLIYDKNDPSRVFKEGEIVKVNDLERAKTMLSLGLGFEIEEAKNYKELDPQKKEGAENVRTKTVRKRKVSTKSDD